MWLLAGSAAVALPPGDLNQDGTINALDLFEFASQWRSSGTQGDLDHSGQVDGADLLLLAEDFRAARPVPDTPTPTATPTAPPTATATATPQSVPAEFQAAFAKVNQYRALAGLAPVEYDPVLADGCQKHAEYLATNGYFNVPNVHDEESNRPGFTPEGQRAARNSDVAIGTNLSAAGAVDLWIEGVYHRIPILSPQLPRIGLGRAPTGNSFVVVLDIQQSLDFHLPFDEEVVYPGANQTNVPLRFNGHESPDPLQSCGFSRSVSGYIVSLTWPLFSVTATDIVTTLTRVGQGALTTCIKLPTDSAFQRNSVFIIPRDDLAANTTYEARVQATVTDFEGTRAFDRTWRFSTGATVQTKALEGVEFWRMDSPVGGGGR